jgi:WD40 repeat protein
VRGESAAFVAGAERRLQIVDTASACVLAEIELASTSSKVAFSRRRPLVAVTAGSSVHFFNVPSACTLARPINGIAGATTIAFIGDDRLAVLAPGTGGPNDGLQLHTVDLRSERVDQSRQVGAATASSFDPGGRWLALASGARVRLIDVATGAARASASLPSPVLAVAVAPDAAWTAAVTDQQRLHVWRGVAMQPGADSQLPESIHGELIAVGSNRAAVITEESLRSGMWLTLRSWNLSPVTEAAPVRLGTDRSDMAPGVCGFADGGTRVAIRARGIGIIVRESDRDIAVLDEAAGEERCTFSTDGRYLAVARNDITIWDVTRQTAVSRIELGPRAARLAFSAANHYLAVVTEGGRMFVVMLRPRDLLDAACARLSSNIKSEDWTRFVGPEPIRLACPSLGEAQ